MPSSKIYEIFPRNFYLMLLVVSCIGRTSTIILPKISLVGGTCGHLLVYMIIFMFVGVPLVFMEITVGQFTSRDCIDVWRTREVISHLGYMQVIWQAIIMLYSHVLTSVVVYYLMISFENPLPYYKCGKWAEPNCNILVYNYTVNQACLKTRYPEKYCNEIHKTYPEYQYWRLYVLEGKSHVYGIAWRVCAASALVCILMCVSCFKRAKSMKWFLFVYSIYPYVGSIILLMGSLLQKGVVEKFGDAFDFDFSIFVNKFKLGTVIEKVVFSLNGGTGLLMNLSSRVSFRSPCLASGMLLISSAIAFTTISTFIAVFMACPYAFEYHIDIHYLLSDKDLVISERMPHMLLEYNNNRFYLMIAYSTYTVVGVGKENVIFFSLTEMIFTRYKTLSRYPGLISMAGAIFVFLLTMPFISAFGIYVILSAYRSHMCVLSSFMAFIECITFIYVYGVDRLSEDVHFMQGTKASSYMKVTWCTAGVAIGYGFLVELVYMLTSVKYLSDMIGTFIVITFLLLFFVIGVVKIIVSAVKKRTKELFRLDLKWGPKDDVMKHSRAMFTAQAMTKEYIYRQYHLQAGIVARQCSSNVRQPPALAATHTLYTA